MINYMTRSRAENMTDATHGEVPVEHFLGIRLADIRHPLHTQLCKRPIRETHQGYHARFKALGFRFYDSIDVAILCFPALE
jgi:hypothetical protein